jgi:coenzyme F420-reducing hydrogenase delta subunit
MMMATQAKEWKPTILILATLSGGYAGADSVGQLHVDYPTNTYIFPVLCPCVFPERFYLDTFEKGVDGILVMYSGTDSPYKGGPERAAEIINRVYPMMTERGINPKRLRLVAICTVCTRPFLKEVNEMNQLLETLGPIQDELSSQSISPAQAS